MKICICSSWRNAYYSTVLFALQQHGGFDCYDFRDPEYAFHWSEIDSNWREWSQEEYLKALLHPVAKRGLKRDWDALMSCDTCVLVEPCGRSAHLELGYAIGAGKRTVVYIPEPMEPELMMGMADRIVTSMDDLLGTLMGMDSGRSADNGE